MQVNAFGLLENVHDLTDLGREYGVQTIAVFDPIHLATGGLVPPSKFGKDEQGVDMIVGEGQHLALSPNFGGPGLGIFAIRFNEKQKTAIRATPGRFVGQTIDALGQKALCMVLSTREQHIRRERATSNICSNQSFLTTIVGAGILARGEEGMSRANLAGVNWAKKLAPNLTAYSEVSLAFPSTAAYNEICLKMDIPVKEVIAKARKFDLHLGVDLGGGRLLISFSDIHNRSDVAKLEEFFRQTFTPDSSGQTLPEIPKDFLRQGLAKLPNFSQEELKEFYSKLSEQNISPDSSIYPLGSCTMKYNPYINDWAASLPGFANLHPQAPTEDAQGSLEFSLRFKNALKRSLV